MSLRVGDTFFAPWPKPDAVYHLFVVVSNLHEDREHVLAVPIMTWDEGKEATCLLEPGDHPFTRHTSYINYRLTELITAEHIETRIADQRFRTHEPVSGELLPRIRQGAGRSDFLPLEYRDILEAQGLVEPL